MRSSLTSTTLTSDGSATGSNQVVAGTKPSLIVLGTIEPWSLGNKTGYFKAKKKHSPEVWVMLHHGLQMVLNVSLVYLADYIAQVISYRMQPLMCWHLGQEKYQHIINLKPNKMYSKFRFANDLHQRFGHCGKFRYFVFRLVFFPRLNDWCVHLESIIRSSTIENERKTFHNSPEAKWNKPK